MAKRKKRSQKKTSDQDEGSRDEGLLWVQEVQVRPKALRTPMARMKRMKSSLGFHQEDILDDGTPQATTDSVTSTPLAENGFVGVVAPPIDDSEDDDGGRQYTVHSVRTPTSLWERILARFFVHGDTDDYSYTPANLFVNYINWTFQWGFFSVFFSFCVIFFLLNIVFAALLKLAGDAYPGCIMVSGEIYGSSPGTRFADAFALSWTTFTTVGYGMIFTSTGTDYGDQGHCSVIVFLCTTESFVGLLYAGMCAAILFGKVGRIQSYAQVKFSNALCIELAKEPKGLKEPETPQSVMSHASMPQFGSPQPLIGSPQLSPSERTLPCPVLKFQVVNKLSNTQGGEIVDANMRAVASNGLSPAVSSTVISSFVKVQLAEFEHPYFNYVWQGRHVLDANSPLLTTLARATIRQNGGWPQDWNNPRDLRNALQLNDLIIILTGISNVSAATVHGYKRYQYDDLLVGYEFAPVLYKDQDSNNLKVDMSLCNDVIQQSHCNAEIVYDSEPETDDPQDKSTRVVSTRIRLDAQL